MKMSVALGGAFCWITALSVQAQAQVELARDINESVLRLPTSVQTIFKQVVSKEMVVTQFKPDGDGPFPIAVLLHGRSPVDRSKPERVRFTQAARYFVRRGFAVWVPTRLGYGDSGTEPDPEYTGTCSGKIYQPGYEAAATSALDVIAYAKKQSYTDPQRIIVLGQSYGGATSIALAAKNPTGVVATINFAGGGGGNPETQPNRPCRPDLLRDMFGAYGSTARTPSLWIYTENDKYFGPDYPKQWYAEFNKQGGKNAEYQAMPAFGENGHLLFSRGFSIWRPVLDAFLAKQGFAIPRSEGDFQLSTYAKLDELEKLPLQNPDAREKYQRFLQLDIPRAYAIGPKGEFAYMSALDAVPRALDLCKKRANAACQLYAVDEQVVWKDK